jgi:hypothetical protein
MQEIKEEYPVFVKARAPIIPEQAECMTFLFGGILLALNVFVTIILFYEFYDKNHLSEFMNVVFLAQTWWLAVDVVLSYVGLICKSSYGFVSDYTFISMIFHFLLTITSIAMVIPIIYNLIWGATKNATDIPLLLSMISQPILYFIMISNFMSFKKRRGELAQQYELVNTQIPISQFQFPIAQQQFQTPTFGKPIFMQMP